METLKQILDAEGREIVQSLRQQMVKYNRNASGRTSESIHYSIKETENETIFEVTSSKVLPLLQEGRGATKSKGGKGFTNQIKQWIIFKNIQSDLPIEQLAFLITRKINREGYKGSKGLISDVINEDLITDIEQKISDVIYQQSYNEVNSFVVNFNK